VPASIAELKALEKLAQSSRPEAAEAWRSSARGASAATKLARRFWAPDLNLTFSRNAV